MSNFRFYAINLLSENCIESCKLYEDVFGFKRIHSSENHSELEINSEQRLIFSKNSSHCKIDSGSFTLTLEKMDIEFLKSKLKSFFLESYLPEKKYASFLDNFGNRIWFYESKN